MIVNLSNKLFEKLKKKTYRDAYVAENARTGIAYQIRAMREQRSMQQGSLASKLGKPQSVVSRLENPDYGKPFRRCLKLRQRLTLRWLCAS